MASRKRLAGSALAALLVVAATVYVFTAPYSRIAGVRSGCVASRFRSSCSMDMAVIRAPAITSASAT